MGMSEGFVAVVRCGGSLMGMGGCGYMGLVVWVELLDWD